MADDARDLGHLRVSDDERQRMATTLSEAAGRGLLTLGEVDERMAAAYAAKTRADLAVLVADLPPAPLPPPAAVVAPARRRPFVTPLVVLAAVLAVGLFVLAMVVSGGHVLFPLLFLGFFVTRAAHGHGHHHRRRQHHRGGPYHQHVHHHYQAPAPRFGWDDPFRPPGDGPNAFWAPPPGQPACWPDAPYDDPYRPPGSESRYPPPERSAHPYLGPDQYHPRPPRDRYQQRRS